MKKKLFTILALLSAQVAIGQWGPNQIPNPSMESGSVPPGSLLPGQLPTYVNNWSSGCTVNGSADVFDPAAPDCANDPGSVDVPNNKWGVLSAANGNRYLGFTSGEPVMGQVDPAFITTGCQYRLRFQWAVSTNILPNNCGGASTVNPNINMTIEVRLRQSANPCGPSFLLYTTPGANLTAWNAINYVFTATAAMTGYDRIEFTAVNIGLVGKPVFLDNVGLEKAVNTVAVTGGGSSSICQGQSIGLTSTGTGTWTASPADPSLAGQTTNNNITVSPTQTTTYTFSNSCSSAQITVTVNANPVANLGPNQTVCSPINLCTPAGAGNTYQWSTPGICLNGGNCTQTCATGNYCVTVTNSAGCTATDCAFITLSSSPTGSITFSPANPCPGDPVNLGVLTSCTNCTYQWSNGATSANTTVNPTVNTTYTVTITNPSGCSTVLSQLVTLSTNCLPVQFCKYINDGITTATRDRGESVIKTSDGGIALVGSMFQSGTDNDIYFVKFAPNLTVQCSLRLGDVVTGSILNETGFSVMQASDGFYYVTGTVNVAAGNNDVFVLKLNMTNCNTSPIVWSMRFGQNNFNESSVKILEMPGASGNPYDLLIVGSAFSGATSASDILAMKVSNTGNYIDSRVYYPVGTPTTNEFGRDAIRLVNSPGRYIIVGDSREPNNNAIVLAIDQNLVMSAFRVLDGGRNESALGVTELGTQIFVTGRSNHFNIDNDLVVFRMNSNLTGAVGTFTYGTSVTTTREIGYKVRATAAGNIIIAGSCFESTATNLNGLILQINPLNMNVQFAKKTTQTGFYQFSDEFLDIVEISNGNFVVTGYTGLSATDEEIFIGKFDSLSFPLNECCLVNYPMTVNSYTPTGPNMDQKQVPMQKNNHGRAQYYYAENFTCSQNSSFRTLNPESEGAFIKPSAISDEFATIFPNPNGGTFQVKPHDETTVINQITIYDASGRAATFQQQRLENNVQIQLDRAAQGIYFIELRTEDGRRLLSKIMVKE